MAAHMDRVKLLVVGDSGVGKSSLIHGLVMQEVLYCPTWTIGCNVEVMPFTYCGGQGHEREVFLEFWEIGGSTGSKESRGIFYSGVNGLILVHDLSNRKSFQNLNKWIREVLNAGRQELAGVTVRSDKEKVSYDDDTVVPVSSGSIPIIVVGAKEDQVATESFSRSVRSIGLSDDLDIAFVDFNCHDQTQFQPTSGKWPQIEAFLNKVIETRFYPSGRILTQESEYWRSRRKVF